MAVLKKLVAALIAGCVLAASNNGAAAEEKVVFTQFLHRHGARSPLPPANQSRWCSDRGCGLLNEEGKDMLYKLGALLRDRYATLNPSYFPTTTYDADLISTRSTNVLRTILSAECLLTGLFPNKTTPFLPIINILPKLEDSLLYSDSFQAYSQRMKYLVSSGKLRDMLQPYLVTAFGDPETNATAAATLATMADEVSLQGTCETVGYSVCVGYIQDIVVSLLAEGKGAVAPTASANLEPLNYVFTQMQSIFYGYDVNTNGADGDTPADVKARGTCGQALAQEMVANADSYIAGTMSFKVMHYSAHDTTITPLAVTLGDDSLYLTGYGQFVLLDLIEDSGAYYVRGIKGAPQQTPGPHAFTTSTLRLGGITAAGVTYYAANDTDRVPLDDLRRFIDSTKPTSPEGLCYLTSAISKAIDQSSLGASPAGNLLTYRQVCLQFACPATGYLTFPNYVCSAFPSGSGGNGDEKKSHEVGLVIGVAIGIAVVGLGIGFIIGTVRKGRRAASDRATLINDYQS